MINLYQLPKHAVSDRSQIEEIKERLDIVTVVKEYIPQLKKSGRNHFGRCPFHSEKTPSFSVNSELGLYKCFGCGEGGDVIKFIEKIERLDFVDALQLTAKKAGVKLKRVYSQKEKKYAKEKKRLLEANNLACKYYHYVLTKLKQGESARKYVKQRKLRKKEIQLFKIGFAPPGFENIKQFLNKKGFQNAELVKWGLLVSKNGRIYDKFRNRLMFPIMNVQGDVVGFSGRIITKDEYGPKYLNSPETLVYKKSEVLYGLFQAKESLRKKDFAIIVEGNIDPLSSHKEGVQNIVAPLGTALTDRQMKLLCRYCEEVLFALDTDAAGEKALLRGLELAEEIGLKVKALELGDYQDVDDLISAGEDWKKVVKNAEPIVKHLIKRFQKKYDIQTGEGKAAYAKDVLRFITKLSQNIEKAYYLEQLSAVTKIDIAILKGELEVLKNNQGKQVKESFVHKVQKHEDHLLEKYFLAQVYNHPEWQKKIKVSQAKKALQDRDYYIVFKSIIGKQKGKLTDVQQSIQEEIALMQVIIFEEYNDFHSDIEQILKRLKEGIIMEQLKHGTYQNMEDSVSEIKKLAEERRKLMTE